MRVRYYYDKLGRLHNVNTGVEGTSMIVGSEYYYLDNPNSNSTTPLISKIDAHGVIMEYEYDANGQITKMTDGGTSVTYAYDAISQLIRTDDPFDFTGSSLGTTWIFTYDLGGNILTKVAYPYTDPNDPVSGTGTTITYTYGNAGWKDQLTAYNNVPIQYDAIGNPINDGTWTYTWQHGKQLAQMSSIGSNETISFEYNEDGLRTKKTSIVTGTTEYTLHGKKCSPEKVRMKSISSMARITGLQSQYIMAQAIGICIPCRAMCLEWWMRVI